MPDGTAQSYEPVLGAAAAWWSLTNRRYTEVLLIGVWAHAGLLASRNIPIYVIVVARPGVAPAAELPPPLAAEWDTRSTEDRRRLESPQGGAIYAQAIAPHAISSTAIRRVLAEGAEAAALRGLLPPAVLAYIARNQLYRSR